MDVVERLIQIEERLNAITSDRWVYKAGDDSDDHYILTHDGEYIAQTTYDTLSTSMEHSVVSDSEFIAHAPEDIKYLLELIKKLIQ